MSSLVFSVPAEFRRGNYNKDEQREVNSAVQLIKLICTRLNIPDLGATRLLDIGCGTKLVQAIIDREFPIEHYAGVDVFPELIRFLQTNVADPRFSFHLLNAQNEMYNPEGEPLTASTTLPVEEHSFDVITLFSVFTHLAPHDYVAMLQMLRRYIKPEGRILFSLFVNETTPGGQGYLDHWTRNMNEQQNIDPSFTEAFTAAASNPKVPDFFDAIPSQPLKIAMYSREHALRLVEGTGWAVETLNDPEAAIQHFMICKPV